MGRRGCGDDPQLALTLFNYHAATFNPTLRDRVKFTPGKIATLLKQRTATLPYNIELRKSER